MHLDWYPVGLPYCLSVADTGTAILLIVTIFLSNLYDHFLHLKKGIQPVPSVITE